MVLACKDVKPNSRSNVDRVAGIKPEEYIACRTKNKHAITVKDSIRVKNPPVFAMLFNIITAFIGKSKCSIYYHLYKICGIKASTI